MAFKHGTRAPASIEYLCYASHIFSTFPQAPWSKFSSTLDLSSTASIFSLMVTTLVYPEEPLRQSAFTQYVIQQVEPKVIAYRLRLPVSVVREWVTKDEWVKHRSEFRSGALSAFQASLAQYAAATAAPMIERLVQIQHLIMDQLEERLLEVGVNADGEEVPVQHSPRTLKEMSGTLKDMKDVGIDTLLYAVHPDRRKEKDDGGGPRVQVNVLASLLDARNAAVQRPEMEAVREAASIQPVTKKAMAEANEMARPAIDVAVLESATR